MKDINPLGANKTSGHSNKVFREPTSTSQSTPQQINKWKIEKGITRVALKSRDSFGINDILHLI